MRIGVDATCWHLPRGFGRHTRCLLTALIQVDSRNEYTFFTDTPDAAPSLGRLGRVVVVPSRMPIEAWASTRRCRRIADMAAMSRALSTSSVDLVVFPTVYSYVPIVSRARKLMMFHDVTAERFPRLTLDGWAARTFWNAKIALARRQADVIVTVSEYSKRALAREFDLDLSTLHVVGEAADPVFRRLADPPPTERLVALGLGGPARAIVYVGGFSPHKNLPMLLDAFAGLAREPGFEDLVLALVGEHEKETFFSVYADVRAHAQRLGLERRVVFTGFLADEDLVVLLNRATVLVLPSMMEGFGLPAIEAAQCGCPVIATKESPLPELLAGGGVFIDPARPDELDRALRLVLESPADRAGMQQAAWRAAQNLTWTAAARALVAVMEQAVAA